METINILSTEKNGFQTLSNLLTPSFAYTISQIPRVFQTVEHCYQCYKAVSVGNNKLALEIYKSKNGWEAKKLGKLVTPNSEWELEKFSVIEKMMDACFEQNPSHKQLLLDTGEARLIHTHPTLNLKDWGFKFPEILMNLRQKYKQDERNIANNTVDSLDAINTTTDI